LLRLFCFAMQSALRPMHHVSSYSRARGGK
jgi:hypothetical protein